MAPDVAGDGRPDDGGVGDGGSIGDGGVISDQCTTLGCAGADAALGNWALQNPPDNPGKLWAPKLAPYPDAPNGAVVVLYGGDRSVTAYTDPNPTGEMWQYDGDNWEPICGGSPDDPCGPGPRSKHGLVYDSHRAKLVLFGGVLSSTQLQPADIWEYDGSWQRVITTGEAPTPRHSMFMVYDSRRKRTVIFGGVLLDGAVGEPVVVDENYEYDGLSQTWFGPIDHPSSPSPGSRHDAGSAAAFSASAADPILRNKMLIYGGSLETPNNANAPGRDDLWAWDGANWERLCNGCTETARWLAGLVFAEQTGDLLLVGGWTGMGAAGEEIPGTWSWFGTDQKMRQISDIPGARDSVGLAYYRAKEAVVLYGGNGASCANSHCDETYELSLATP